MSPFCGPHPPPIPHLSPSLPSCPSPKTRLAAVWQADAACGHFGSPWAERSLRQMGQLSSADLEGEPFICLLMEGHVQHHKGGMSCRDQQPLHGSPSWPLATPTRRKQFVNTLHGDEALAHVPFSVWTWETMGDGWRDVVDAHCVYMFFGSQDTFDITWILK